MIFLLKTIKYVSPYFLWKTTYLELRCCDLSCIFCLIWNRFGQDLFSSVRWKMCFENPWICDWNCMQSYAIILLSIVQVGEGFSDFVCGTMRYYLSLCGAFKRIWRCSRQSACSRTSKTSLLRPNSLVFSTIASICTLFMLLRLFANGTLLHCPHLRLPATRTCQVPFRNCIKNLCNSRLEMQLLIFNPTSCKNHFLFWKISPVLRYEFRVASYSQIRKFKNSFKFKSFKLLLLKNWSLLILDQSNLEDNPTILCSMKCSIN